MEPLGEPYLLSVLVDLRSSYRVWSALPNGISLLPTRVEIVFTASLLFGIRSAEEHREHADRVQKKYLRHDRVLLVVRVHNFPIFDGHAHNHGGLCETRMIFQVWAL